MPALRVKRELGEPTVTEASEDLTDNQDTTACRGHVEPKETAERREWLVRLVFQECQEATVMRALKVIEEIRAALDLKDQREILGLLEAEERWAIVELRDHLENKDWLDLPGKPDLRVFQEILA